MIRPAQQRDLDSLRCDDPFYTRVLSLFLSYGAGYDFVGFWVQMTDDEPVALISRFEDKFSLFLTKDSDLEEIAAFLRFQGAGAVMFDDAYGVDIHAENSITGQVLCYRGEFYNSDLEIYQPDFKELYQLLKSCESEIFRVPEELLFLSDVTHRANLGKCRVIAARVGEKLASSVMTVSETDDAAILGAVATHPDYRKRGLSRELVKTLASKIKSEGRDVYVFSASETNTRFYENSGFEIVAGFREMLGSLYQREA